MSALERILIETYQGPAVIEVSGGPQGRAATVAIGTVSTGAAGSSATVTNSGNQFDATFDFTIPRGDTGTAATISVGTVTTGAAGSSATVTNSGTSSAAVLNFTIPRGNTGATGATGAAGPNTVTSATTSDGTGNLSLASLTVGGVAFTAKANLTGGNTFAGAQTISGQLQLTGQLATDANSAMTRGLADARYGLPAYFAQLANPVNYTNDATGGTILTLALPAGTYLVEQLVRFTTNGGNSRCVITNDVSPVWSGYRGTIANGASPVRIYAVNAGSGGTPFATTSNADNHERGGILVTTLPVTLSVVTSQSTASATTTTVGAGSYIVARRIA